MIAVYLEKWDPARRQFRFYRIMVCRTLFGPWAMIREWGRIGSPGTVRESWYESEQEAQGAGEKLLKRKQGGDTKLGKVAGFSSYPPAIFAWNILFYPSFSHVVAIANLWSLIFGKILQYLANLP